MTQDELRSLKIGDKVRVNNDLYIPNSHMRSIRLGFISPVYLIEVKLGRVGILGAVVDYKNLDRIYE